MREAFELTKNLTWRSIDGELSVRTIAGKRWLCAPGAIESETVIPRDSGNLSDEVAEVLGDWPFVEYTKPLHLCGVDLSQEQVEKSLIDFTRTHGLLRNLSWQDYSTPGNPTGIQRSADLCGILPVDEWLIFCSEVRAAVDLLRLAAGARRCAASAERDLRSRFQITRNAEGQVDGVSVFYLCAQSNEEGLSRFSRRLRLFGRGLPEDSETRFALLLAVADDDLAKLAMLAAARLVQDGLADGLSVRLVHKPSRSGAGYFIPRFQAKTLRSEIWLELSERLTKWEDLRVCELEGCSRLFFASRRGGKGREKRHCCEKHHQRAAYLSRKAAMGG